MSQDSQQSRSNSRERRSFGAGGIVDVHQLNHNSANSLPPHLQQMERHISQQSMDRQIFDIRGKAGKSQKHCFSYDSEDD